MDWTATESRLLASRLRVFTVVFLLKEFAKSWPEGFCMLALTSCKDVMYVLCSIAFANFGATRGSKCGKGICRLLKLKSVSVGSFRWARWTIHTIQSERLLLLPGSPSSTKAARSVMDSIIAAYCWSTSSSWGSSEHWNEISQLVSPAAFVAVTQYVVSSVATSGVPDITPVFSSSTMPEGSSGSTQNVTPKPSSKLGSTAIGDPTT
mmetsp:Transcript_121278/g.190241  ORF Transcript_121278/g.190241 Transcript_121278/m.190241 type:complete len:207 (+) Transcript_121278:763-1383(+)